MNESVQQQLEALVAPVDDREVEAALRHITRRGRRERRALALAGVAAVSSSVVGAVAVMRSADDAPDAAAVGGEAEWPWTTETTAVTLDLGEAEFNRVKDEVVARINEPDAAPYVKSCCDELGTYDVVRIGLRADAVALAEEFWQRWGPAVRIRVGYRIYPTGEPSEEAAACPAIEAGEPIPGLEARLELQDDGVVHSGAELIGTLVLHNTTDEAIRVVAPKTGDVVMPGGTDEIGSWDGPITMEYRTTDVPAGGTAETGNIRIGTTTCGPDGPPGVVPGDYEALVMVSQELLYNGDEERPPRPNPMLVRAPLTVVD